MRQFETYTVLRNYSIVKLPFFELFNNYLTRSSELHTANMFRTSGHSRPAVVLGALGAWAIRVPLDEANYVNSARLGRSYGPKIVQMWTVAPCFLACLLYTSPSPRDGLLSRMPSSA